MRVSTKSDYALRALIELASRDSSAAVSAEDLGKLQEIPTNFLQAILGDLRKAGILTSVRGSAGGWRLAQAVEEISIADVIRAIDGPLLSVYGVRPEAIEYQGSATALQHIWIAARASLRQVLEQTTLADLRQGELPAHILALTAADEAWESR